MPTEWPKVEKREGDITSKKLKADLILHQANCVLNNGGESGLAKTLLEKYGYANIYSGLYKNRKPGDVIVSHPSPGWDGPSIAHILGQRLLGGPSSRETKKMRLEWFDQALKKLFLLLKENLDKYENKNEYRIAMPHHIGCGLAGGDIEDYTQYVSQFMDQCRIHVKRPTHFIILHFHSKTTGKPLIDG